MPSRELGNGCTTDDSMSTGLAINAVHNGVVLDNVANSMVSEQLAQGVGTEEWLEQGLAISRVGTQKLNLKP